MVTKKVLDSLGRSMVHYIRQVGMLVRRYVMGMRESTVGNWKEMEGE